MSVGKHEAFSKHCSYLDVCPSETVQISIFTHLNLYVFRTSPDPIPRVPPTRAIPLHNYRAPCTTTPITRVGVRRANTIYMLVCVMGKRISVFSQPKRSTSLSDKHGPCNYKHLLEARFDDRNNRWSCKRPPPPRGPTPKPVKFRGRKGRKSRRPIKCF